MSRAIDDLLLDEGENAVPIGQLGLRAEVVREVLASGRPSVVTEGGVGVAVILDARTFETLKTDAAAQHLLGDLRRALVEADDGDLVDHEEVLADLHDHFSGRVPDDLLRRLRR